MRRFGSGRLHDFVCKEFLWECGVIFDYMRSSDGTAKGAICASDADIAMFLMVELEISIMRTGTWNAANHKMENKKWKATSEDYLNDKVGYTMAENASLQQTIFEAAAMILEAKG
jgi:hypothetical protein